jgi:hypothetical protein
MSSMFRVGLSILALGHLVPTIYAETVAYTNGIGFDGVTQELAVGRTPTLFTGDFGDCLGGQSLLNVTKYDTGLYYDNSTIVFHLDGTTSLQSEDVMRRSSPLGLRLRFDINLPSVYISIQAYGENSFNLTVNPCSANISRYAHRLLVVDRASHLHGLPQPMPDERYRPRLGLRPLQHHPRADYRHPSDCVPAPGF